MASLSMKLCNGRYFPLFPGPVSVPIYEVKGRNIISACMQFECLALLVWGCISLPVLEEDAVCKGFS